MSKVPDLDLRGTTCIWGQSESGKSWLAQKMLAKANPPCAVIIDPMSATGVDANGVRDALAKRQKRIICNDNRKDHQIGAILLALGASTPAAPVYVVADEAPSYMDAPRAGLQKAVLQGRHAGFGILLLGQRPASVYAEYRTQAKATYWLKLSDHTDLQTARKSLGAEADKLPSFKQGDFIKWPK